MVPVFTELISHTECILVLVGVSCVSLCPVDDSQLEIGDGRVAQGTFVASCFACLNQTN